MTTENPHFPFIFSHVDLEETLQSSFVVLDQALLQIEETASELQYQSAVPQHQLNEIIVSMHEVEHKTTQIGTGERKKPTGNAYSL